MQDLVKRQKFVTKDKAEVIKYILSKAQPGVNFEILYYCKPESNNPLLVLENLNLCEDGYINCDKFLISDYELDLDKLEAELEKELAKLDKK